MFFVERLRNFFCLKRFRDFFVCEEVARFFCVKRLHDFLCEFFFSEFFSSSGENYSFCENSFFGHYCHYCHYCPYSNSCHIGR